ncbi:nucleotidyltransferase [Phormidesmis priestleyi ULC007]|uniref:Nucleotidyltransferase n=2 Tax=Phormidesmis priestleyi TaxID=268141 RepID=A0A2T1D7Y9_9CYAN|nr:nucleotidyltransferase domain-containing protein [Phormidesmis priestleyi]PSB16625.1 nucleotidyltransferase [Phormidesmis priestleyi ULC007]PZO47528.1 MAG: nucleotidyltransferase [Phormidesmis priestleyi]
MLKPITEAQMAVYRATAQRLAQERVQQLRSKHQRAWEVARQAAQILKQQFGAQQVAIFGSMLSRDRVHERSDLDIAVWGLDQDLYYQAVSRLLDLDPSLPIDLVEVERAKPKIRAAIEHESVVL